MNFGFSELTNKIDELMDIEVDMSERTAIVNTVPADTILQDEVREVVTFLNWEYLMNGEYPKIGKILEKFEFLNELSSEAQVDFFKQVNDILENARDLPPFELRIKTVRVMDPQFVAACNLIFDVSDKRTLAAKLKDVGLTTKKFHNLCRLKHHKEFYEMMIDQTLQSEVWNEARMALARNVINGDLPSIKFFAEMEGKFTQKSDFDPRMITVILGSVLEIISRNVDGVVARKIADEIEDVAVKSLGTGVIDV